LQQLISVLKSAGVLERMEQNEFKGRSFGELGKYDETTKCFDTVLEIDPKSVGALNNKGNVIASTPHS
jgi:hypothetical protein